MPSPRRRSSLTPEYQFDPRLGTTGRYVNKATGRIVARDTVNAALEAQITKARANIRSISESLVRDEISLADWQLGMRQQMKVIHTHSGALAKGGWDQMSQADWGSVGRISRDQYRFLERFAVDIETGKVPLLRLDGEPNGYFLRRADLYGQAGITTHSQMEKREAIKNGAEQERRVLDARAKHCDCCVQQAGAGWQPIGSLIPIGGCTCTTNCRCTFEYRVSDATDTR